MCVPHIHGSEVSQKLSDGKDLLLDLNKIMGKRISLKLELLMAHTAGMRCLS